MKKDVTKKYQTKRPFKIWVKSQDAKRCMLGLLFLTPFVVFLTVFEIIPVFQSIFQSFFQYTIADMPGRFVGLENYKKMFSSSLLSTYFGNTLKLYLLGLLFGFLPPILQALMLFQLKKTRGFFRYLYILPTGITAMAGLSIWKFIWSPYNGLANQLTSAIGLGTFKWLGDENLVLWCLRFPAILGGGMGVVLYLVTMNNIPAEIFEAAKIDGATGWKTIWNITLPGIRDMVKIQLLLGLTSSLLAFDDVYMLTGGGPGFSSTTLVLGAYTKAYKEQNMGQAMAYSVFILFCTLIVVAIVYKQLYKKED